MTNYNFVTLTFDDYFEKFEVIVKLYVTNKIKKKIDLLFPNITALAFSKINVIDDKANLLKLSNENYKMADSVYAFPIENYLSLYSKNVFIAKYHYSKEFHDFLLKNCTDLESKNAVMKKIIS